MDRLESQLGIDAALAQFVGSDPVFRTAIQCLPTIAKADAPVLVEGETGTGKELAAQTIHYLSDRASYPFVAVNCGAITDTLLESELFGHERGAFTGATSSRPGLLLAANGGTVFLDEIDSMSGRGQVALLRFLQTKCFIPVGSVKEIRSDARIVAATNSDLQARVREHAFRADLYYRLCVFRVSLPALRNRSADVPELARHFLRRHLPQDLPEPEFSRLALARLASHDWPGNVRELENVIIRAIHLRRTGTIDVDDLGLPPRSSGAGQPCVEPLARFNDRKHAVIEAFERDYLMELMAAHQGNVTQAARTAGKERRELGKLLKKHGLKAQSFMHHERG